MIHIENYRQQQYHNQVANFINPSSFFLSFFFSLFFFLGGGGGGGGGISFTLQHPKSSLKPASCLVNVTVADRQLPDRHNRKMSMHNQFFFF